MSQRPKLNRQQLIDRLKQKTQALAEMTHLLRAFLLVALNESPTLEITLKREEVEKLAEKNDIQFDEDTNTARLVPKTPPELKLVPKPSEV